ncbi:MAG: porin [Rhodobacteraceae bacterium]|nr:porin [Paracoccaceae bacterium]
MIDIPGDEEEQNVRGGEQYSASVLGSFEMFDAGVVYTRFKNINGEADYINVGVGTTFGAFGLNGFYGNILSADGVFGDSDGDDTWGVGMTYDLGGGATVAGGYASTFDDQDVADFGVRLAF